MGLFGTKIQRADVNRWKMNDQGLVDVGDTMGAPKQPSFWQGGDKFGWRDGLAGILAAVGDAFAQQGGGRGGGVEMLTGGRLSAIDMARKAQLRQQQIEAARQRAIAAGLDPARADLMANDDAKYSDLNNKPTSEMQNFQAWQSMDPATRGEYSTFRDQTDPLITNGYGSTVVPRASIGGAPPGPQPGTIEDGHQFMGGNPADPNSWKPVGGGAGNGAGGFPRFRR
jgi:hypothetical protein